MKIVRIIARLNVGGPAKHVVWLTAGLRGPECESLLVAGTVPPGEEDMGYFAAEKGVEPIFIQEMSREISIKDLVTIWKLYRLFVRERPDLVHTHTAKAGTVGRVAGLLYRWLTPASLIVRPRACRFVHTYHGHIFHSYYGGLKTRLFLTIEKILARLITDRIVVVSDQQLEEIHEKFRVGRREQFAVVPLGMDLEPFANSNERREVFRREFGIDPTATMIGIVGRLTEIKNVPLFLAAAAQLQAEHKLPVKFVVIGDGGLREELEAKARELGLGGDVIFAGNRQDPENFYAALDVVALTSRNEGTPLTLIEAMASERPVISTAVGGVVDLLGAGIEPASNEGYRVCERGVSVAPGNASAFAAGMKRLVEDSSLRRALAENGLEYVRRRHSRERLLEDIRRVYRELPESLNRRELAGVQAANPSAKSR